jgi:hypothetical protein
MTKRNATPDPDELLSSSQAAMIAGLNRTHFARLVAAGKGPEHQRIAAGGRHMVVIRRGDLAAWMAARSG